ncbi:MAG: PTS sugar transporter subunit IIA [Gammaproteobacteria bacterium]|nr:PTS sugar transporter subunit IIA [Gammaproteobacteria bacterium]
MLLKDYISEKGVIFATSVSSKKRALELLSESLAQQHPALTKNKVLDALLAREKLGSTGLGKGIAIPHCRLAEIENIYAAMLKLDEGVEFESADGLAVNFLFCMVVPENAEDEQLQLLSGLAKLLGNHQVRQSIEKCSHAECLYNLLCQGSERLVS